MGDSSPFAFKIQQLIQTKNNDRPLTLLFNMLRYLIVRA